MTAPAEAVTRAAGQVTEMLAAGQATVLIVQCRRLMYDEDGRTPIGTCPASIYGRTVEEVARQAIAAGWRLGSTPRCRRHHRPRPAPTTVDTHRLSGRAARVADPTDPDQTD